MKKPIKLIALFLTLSVILAGCKLKNNSLVENDTSENVIQDTAKNEPTKDALKVGGISVTVMDDDTIMAAVNDPYVLAVAMNEKQVQLKFYTDEASMNQHQGTYALKLTFSDCGDGVIICSVHPQSCVNEKQSDGSYLISDEDLYDQDGEPLVGNAVVTDTKIDLVVQADNIGALAKNTKYYAVYMEYEEYSRGELTTVADSSYVTPDLSETSLKDKVDIRYFDKVLPNYVVMEQDFAPYMSYDHHSIFPGVGRYEGQYFWSASSNSEITKKAVIVASMDAYGIAEYYVAIVYDSHKDLMRDYIEDGEINLTASYGVDNPENVEITDDMLMGFLPEDSEDYYGNHSYTLANNVLYYHYTPNFETHYRSEENGYTLPNTTSIYAGHITNSLYVEEALAQVLRESQIDMDYEYAYIWDDMTKDVVNNMEATSTVSYKGCYYKNTDNTKESDDEKILQEVQRIREELNLQAEQEYQAQVDAPQTVDPSAACYIYDDVSADFGLLNLDMNLLENGGAYEIDFSGYTIRVTALNADAPKSELGRYDGDTFVVIDEASCYRDLDTAPNCIRVNAYLGNTELSWGQVNSFTMYESTEMNGNRRKIEKEVDVTSYR